MALALADYQGIALVLGAAGIFLSGVVTSGIAVATFRRQGRMEAAANARGVVLKAVETQTNGQSHIMRQMAEEKGYDLGVKAGGDEERAHPTTGNLPA